MSDLISLSEWFSTMNTSTLVTAPGWVGVRAAGEVGEVARVAVPLVAPAATGLLLDDAPADGVLLAVEHPDPPRATMATSAPPLRIRATSMRPVKRKR